MSLALNLRRCADLIAQFRTGHEEGGANGSRNEALVLRSLRRLAVAGISSLVASTHLYAQQVPGRVWPLVGVVVDSTGGVVPNAQVQLTCSPTGAFEPTATDPVGAFRFQVISPASCDVIVTFEGFKPATAHVSVGNRPPSHLRIVLTLDRLTEDVTVDASSAALTTAAASNQDASILDQSALDKLPVFEQDVLGTMTRFLDSMAVGTNGPTLIVNGLEADSLILPSVAIQQIKVNQDPYSAEFARPGRGRIEVVTSSGSQAYHGALNGLFRNAALEARNAFATAKPPSERRQGEGMLGGPLGKAGTTSFLLSGRYDANDTQAIVVAQDPLGVVRQNVGSPYRNILAAGTLTHRRDSGTTTSLTVSYQDQSQRNDNVGGLTLPSAGMTWSFSEEDVTYVQQTVIRSTLLNQFRVLVGQEFESRTSLDPGTGIVVLDAFTGGGAQADWFRTEHHITLSDAVTWSHGRQTVKLGFDVPDFSRRRFDDNANRVGTFYFSSLSDYAAGRPYSFIRQEGDGHVVFLEKVLGAFVQNEIRLRSNLSLSLGLRYDWQNYFGDDNNLAPRASFAFRPRSGGATVLRGGAGLFYDRTGPRPIQDVLRYDGQHLKRFIISNPGYPNPLSAGQSLEIEPPSIVVLSPDINIPSSLQYSVGVERQLAKTTTLSVTYIGTRGFDQFRSRDINAPIPPLFLTRPDALYGAIRQIESAGTLSVNSIQTTVRGHVTPWFNGTVQYTLARAMNDTSGITWMPPNSYDLSLEYARADFDQRHRLDLVGVLTPGRLFNLGVALALYSGRPYSLLTGEDDFHTGVANARPPDVPRNSLQGPGYADLDLRWSRDIRLRPATGAAVPTATVGLDVFNVLNRVNASRYIGTITSPFFGRAVSALPPRRVQLSVRYKF